MMCENMKKRLPKVGYYPFWFWNGEQNETEITRQLKLMRKVGCAGAVIHAREGNKIPYLSERWLGLVRFACDEARKLDLKIWLYDEEGYPSGNAGGMVQNSSPEFRQVYLAFDYSPTNPVEPAFAAFDGESYRLLDEAKTKAGTVALRFHKRFVENHVDTLNPESSRRFIDLTHEKYKSVMEELLGDTVEAVYTDDESFLCGGIKGLVWSDVLEDEHTKRRGSDLISNLPLLVENLPGCEMARRRYFKLVQDLFLESFIKPQKEWTNNHGMTYTGHLSADEGPLSRLIQINSSPMPFMMMEDVPGIDDFICDMSDQRYLARPFNDGSTRFFYADGKERAPLMLYKFASSIAHQFKNNLLSAETLTFLSWNCSPAFMDQQMLFELGMGVNLMTPHAFYYTIGDGTRHDCPPSYFFQQPFYELSGFMIRKWTRIAELLRRGTFHADTLLIYPGNLYSLVDGSILNPDFKIKHASKKKLENVERTLANTVLELHRRHIGFDFGDEDIMAEYATIEGRCLRIGEMVYSNVLLFLEITPLSTTKHLLERFQAEGGRVFRIDEIDGIEPDIPLFDGEEILVHARDNQEFREFYLVNLSGCDLKPEIKLDSEFTLYDPMTDRVFFSGSSLPDNFIFPTGSAFFIMSPNFSGENIPFEDSTFAKVSDSLEPKLKNIQPLNDNIFATKETDFEIIIANSALINAIYAEKLCDSNLVLNDQPFDGKPLSPHPADPCYQGMDASKCFKLGVNHILRSSQPDTLYVVGSFNVVGNVLEAPSKLTLGDLSKQGYPFYWGTIEYEFEFEGRWRLLDLELDGIAEVFVNDTFHGVVSGKPSLISVASSCSEGISKLRLCFRNTAQNFVCAEVAPFGISKVLIKR